MTVGQKLTQLRIGRNLTQKDAAIGYGCSRQYLNGVETGKIKISFKAIKKFAKFYGVEETVLSTLLAKKG